MKFLKLRNTSETVENALKSRFSLIILCLWSYTEAFVFPIPPDPFLIALILVNRNSFLLYISLCTISSILGGITGYYIGFVFAEEILCLMLIPGLDMMRVSFKRIIIGKNPLTGDENHLHHRIKNKLNSNYALIINFLITIIPIIIYKIYNLNLLYIIFLGLIIYYSVFFIFKFNFIFEEKK